MLYISVQYYAVLKYKSQIDVLFFLTTILARTRFNNIIRYLWYGSPCIIRYAR